MTATRPINRSYALIFARLKGAFADSFGWDAYLEPTTATMAYLIFTDGTGESIMYDVEPYKGGLAVLQMHVRLTGKTEDLLGNDMCWRTFAIINVPVPVDTSPPSAAATGAKIDVKEIANRWYAEDTRCKMQEDPVTGQALSNDQGDAACWRRKVLADELFASGWCFDKGEQEWRICQ